MVWLNARSAVGSTSSQIDASEDSSEYRQDTPCLAHAVSQALGRVKAISAPSKAIAGGFNGAARHSRLIERLDCAQDAIPMPRIGSASLEAQHKTCENAPFVGARLSSNTSI